MALFSNTTGGQNTAGGLFAMVLNTSGSNNTAYGYKAFESNTSAGRNVAVGNQAMRAQSFNNAGTAWSSNNVAVGFQALFANQPTSTTTGVNNTAIGSNALQNNTTGSNHIALGNGAGSNLTTGNDNIAIGSAGVADEAATIRIGTDGTHTKTVLVGNVGIGANAPSAALEVNGDLAVTGALRVPGAGVGTTGTAFIHSTTAGNVVSNINHPLCDGDPNAILIVTHNAAGGVGVHNHPVGVGYDGVHWYIFNEDFAFMPAGVRFNVLIIKP